MTSANLDYLKSIKSLLQTGAARQLMFMLGVTISVVMGIVIFMSIQEPTYAPLDYQITEKNMGAIIDTLDKSGIRYKINDKDGLILVPVQDVRSAKIKLSSAGIAKDDSIGYSFLNDQNSFGNSQFLENIRYLRALENDLSKTISTIEGITAARVHIAIPQNTVFADENNKVTASVMISIAPGLLSDKEKIRSIMQIMADSVPGLDPKNVAIIDQYGHYLSQGMDQGIASSTEQLTYQNNLQSYYEKRIEAIVIPLLGQNKVNVRVNANIDFTQQENAQEQYDPEKKVLQSEESTSSQESSAGASGVPGSLSNTPPESGDAAAASASSGSSSSGQQSSHNSKHYKLSKSVTYKKENFAKIVNLSVAVVVDDEVVTDPKTNKTITKPLSPEKIKQITDLVKATIGYQEGRGDKVTVVNSGFTPVLKSDLVSAAPRLWDQPWFWEIVKKIIGIVIGFIFLIFLYKKTSHHLTESRNLRFQAEKRNEVDPDVKLLESKQERIGKLKKLAVEDPNKVASIIKNWAKKD